jgi:arylsulfatase A-like enzyme
MREWVVAALVTLTTLTFVTKQKPNVEQPTVSGTRDNLVFITVDTLRADHTPFSDYARPTMPATGEFFHDGLNFTAAETVRTTTGPSYAAMLSGLYPYHSGVRNNFVQLNDEIDTLQEKLQRSGYNTAAFVSSFVMNARMSGFKQGFDI